MTVDLHPNKDLRDCRFCPASSTSQNRTLVCGDAPFQPPMWHSAGGATLQFPHSYPISVLAFWLEVTSLLFFLSFFPHKSPRCNFQSVMALLPWWLLCVGGRNDFWVHGALKCAPGGDIQQACCLCTLPCNCPYWIFFKWLLESFTKLK